MLPELTEPERQRYARHLSIPDVGEEGQRRLKAASVLCIGAGGLGSPAAAYLAAAGVGRIGIVDPDEVELSNLQRQILHGQSTLGRSKLDSAMARLRDINPEVAIEPHPVRFTPDNAAALLERYDLLLDGSDNFPTRFLSNDACVLARKPLVYGAIFRFEGQVTVFAPHLGGSCYRCMLPGLPPPGAAPSCAEAGVLGVLPGIIGSLQAMEAIKLILGVGAPPLGELLSYDALRSRFRTLRIPRNPGCVLCGESPTLDHLRSAETMAAPSCAPAGLPSIDAQELAARLTRGDAFTLIDVREPQEHAMASIPGARLIPLGELAGRLGEIPRDGEVVVHCKSGARSARAAALLEAEGFDRVSNLEGGIDAWLSLE